VRRETASGYLRAAGIAVREPGRWGHAANPAIEVSTDSAPGRAASASACEPYCEESRRLGSSVTAQRGRDLSRPRHAVRLNSAARERALHPHTARRSSGGALRRDHDGSGRVSAGRLRRRADGARPCDGASSSASALLDARYCPPLRRGARRAALPRRLRSVANESARARCAPCSTSAAVRRLQAHRLPIPNHVEQVVAPVRPSRRHVGMMKLDQRRQELLVVAGDEPLRALHDGNPEGGCKF
jgi:hypothetical protein